MACSKSDKCKYTKSIECGGGFRERERYGERTINCGVSVGLTSTMNNSPMPDLLSSRQYARKAGRFQNKTQERTATIWWKCSNDTRWTSLGVYYSVPLLSPLNSRCSSTTSGVTPTLDLTSWRNVPQSREFRKTKAFNSISFGLCV